MAKYRKKPVVVEATQWFENGDHPLDDNKTPEGEVGPAPGEGKIVRYYRTPDLDGQNECQHCAQIMHDHGWIDTPEGGHIVCPEDWIITGVAGENYPCKDAIFKMTYEPVGD